MKHGYCFNEKYKNKPEGWAYMTKKEKVYYYNSMRSKEMIDENNKKRDRDKLNEGRRKHYEKNKEHFREKAKFKRESNAERQRKYRQNFRIRNADKIQEMDLVAKLKKLFGITLDEYNEMKERQNYCCKICGVHESKLLPKSRLGVDHCHTTGRVRALLCTNCNTGLGQFKDNPETLQRAILYLKGEL